MFLVLVAATLGTSAGDYADSVAALERSRAKLARRWTKAPRDERPAILAEARRVVLTAVAEDLLPAWIGTPWAFYGTTEKPREGTIACGYLVSTVLRDAGFRVERAKLAQQAAEHVILSLRPERVGRFRTGDVSRVLAQVAEWGDGLYVVGLDYHVGFLVRREDETRFCHASYLDPGHVVCSDPSEDAAMESNYHVVGAVLDDAQVGPWLAGRRFPTLTGRGPSG